jgi:diketogulonate reductase-like aldo/keto reductase
MTTRVPQITLNNGIKIPQIGLGTWKLSGKEAKPVIKKAVQTGYRMFDCAPVYGNEDTIGEAFQEILKEGTIKREEMFVTSKLWNTHHSKEHVKGALEQTLKDLRLAYLDLYLMHFPESMQYTGYNLREVETIPKDSSKNILFGKATVQETWQAMEGLLESGKVKAIGICNFNIISLLDLLTYCKIVPSVLQMEVHPCYNRKELIEFASSRGIHTEAYASLGSGKKGGPSEDPKVKEIAKKHSRTVAQVLLRWAVQQKYVVIPKTSSESRLKENFDILDFELDSKDMEVLSNMDRRMITMDTREYWGFPVDV